MINSSPRKFLFIIIIDTLMLLVLFSLFLSMLRFFVIIPAHREFNDRLLAFIKESIVNYPENTQILGGLRYNGYRPFLQPVRITYTYGGYGHHGPSPTAISLFSDSRIKGDGYTISGLGIDDVGHIIIDDRVKPLLDEFRIKNEDLIAKEHRRMDESRIVKDFFQQPDGSTQIVVWSNEVRWYFDGDRLPDELGRIHQHIHPLISRFNWLSGAIHIVFPYQSEFGDDLLDLSGQFWDFVWRPVLMGILVLHLCLYMVSSRSQKLQRISPHTFVLISFMPSFILAYLLLLYSCAITGPYLAQICYSFLPNLILVLLIIINLIFLIKANKPRGITEYEHSLR